MLESPLLLKFIQLTEASAINHKEKERTVAAQSFDDSIAPIIAQMYEYIQIPDLLFRNRVHQFCIHFDRERMATTEKERDLFDNMLSETYSARNSILLLQEKPDEYRQGVEQAYAPYRKVLRPPAKEASVVAYKNISNQLGHLKRGTSSQTLKDYYTARQTLLRADMDLIVELQCKALGLKAPAKSASQSQSLAI
jgi:hypothetical protein